MLKDTLRPLASLKLTVVLLVLAMALIFAGTFAQVDNSIWTVQKRYFYSLFVWVPMSVFHSALPGGLPLPGGYALGVAMLVNLLAAHILRFNLTLKDLLFVPALAGSFAAAWLVPPHDLYPMLAFLGLASLPPLLVALLIHRNRAGIVLIHLSLILLLLGEGATSSLQRDTRMVLDEGSYSHFTEDSREIELAIVDPSNADHDEVATIAQHRLEKRGEIRHGRLPFDVRVEEFYANSMILGPQQAGGTASARATAGSGVKLTVRPQRPVSGVDNRSDIPSAYVALSRQGQDLGTYLLTLYPELSAPQEVKANGKSYFIQMRFKRYYKPYTLHLIQFSHDRYTGTEMARNFSSRVRLVDPERNTDRQVLIWMNHPLRYRGETFYQASFLPGDKTSILQVVRNPGWLTPYIACAIGTLGLLLHFVESLIGFVARNQAANSASVLVPADGGAYTLPPRHAWAAAGVLVPAVITALCVIYLFSAMRSKQPGGPFDLAAFGRLPISFDGRTQPLDSVARNSLRVIGGRETFKTEAGKRPAIAFLLDTFAKPELAEAYKVFRIDHPDVISGLNLNPEQNYFSFREIVGDEKRLAEQYELARNTEPKRRDAFQRKILDLVEKLSLFVRLREVQGLYLTAPLAPGQEWRPLGEALHAAQHAGAPMHPAAQALFLSLDAYRNNQPEEFARQLSAYTALSRQHLPAVMAKVSFEAFFNRFEPFIVCIVLYILVFVLAGLSWLFWRVPLARAAFAVLIVAILVHTFGLIARIYMQGRPPVTNLYSSAVFIAWGAVLLATALEWLFKNGIGSVTAALTGALSLVVAHQLSADGDTMRMLQAVLDTNFWLASHVITITLGYSATFLAGFLGILYILRGTLTRSLNPVEASKLATGIYGVTCFAMLFSFVGTVLGGIWADQSWGRFWGWDPKENGAVLIVLANALLVHARWARLVSNRGLAMLAIFGNIVTAWSWFGTNMLGVGLHSYGFMDKAFIWLVLFIVSQILLILLGALPLQHWRSATKGAEA